MNKLVFLSHSSHDTAAARSVCEGLEARGIPAWLSERDILPGTDWGDAIIQAIGRCPVMVLIFTSRANESNHVRREVNIATQSGRVVIPLRLENVRPSHALLYFLTAVHWMDAFDGPLDRHFDDLADQIRQLLSQSAGSPPAPYSTAPSALPGVPVAAPPAAPAGGPVALAGPRTSSWTLRGVLRSPLTWVLCGLCLMAFLILMGMGIFYLAATGTSNTSQAPSTVEPTESDPGPVPATAGGEQVVESLPSREELRAIFDRLSTYAGRMDLANIWYSREWRRHYSRTESRDFLIETARNAVQQLPAECLYFTNGDDDTYPTHFVLSQSKSTVRHVSIPLLGVPDYRDWILSQLDQPVPGAWSDSTPAVADVVDYIIDQQQGARRIFAAATVDLAASFGDRLSELQPAGLVYELNPPEPPTLESEQAVIQGYSYRFLLGEDGHLRPDLESRLQPFIQNYGIAFGRLADRYRDDSQADPEARYRLLADECRKF